MLGRDDESSHSDPFASDGEEDELDLAQDAHARAVFVQQLADEPLDAADPSSAPVVPLVETRRRRWGDEFQDEGEEDVEQNAEAAAQSALPAEPFMGRSTIGRPGFAYTRGSKPKEGALTHPVTVEFDRIGTPQFSFDRKAGTQQPLNAIVRGLAAQVREIELQLDGGAEMGAVRDTVMRLRADLNRSESALNITAKGRIAFIKIKTFVETMEQLLVDLANLDPHSLEYTDRIGIALMSCEKERAITSGLNKEGHIEQSRSYKFYSHKLRVENTMTPADQFDISVRGFHI